MRYLVTALAMMLSTSLGAEETGEQYASFAGFRLNIGTLADVRTALGPAKLIESGDAGEYEAKLCYRTVHGTVTFLSGEMGGKAHHLLGFGVARTSGNDKSNCPTWPITRAAPLGRIGNLIIGMSRSEFERRVGAKVQRDGSIDRAFFSSTRKFTEADILAMPVGAKSAVAQGISQGYFDVQIAVEGVFTNDQLSALQVWKIETQ